MMPSLPIWPPIFLATSASKSAPEAPGRQRWVIVEGSIRRDVTEHEYRAVLGSCERIEVVRYPHDDAVTHVCYR